MDKDCQNMGVKHAMRKNMGYLGHFGNESVLREGHNTNGKVGKVMREFKHGELHSGSKHGPKVKSRKQAIAIAMSEAGMSRKG